MFSRIPSWKKNNRAFTIPELLAVVAIMSIIISILLPAFARMKHQGRFVKELSAAKQLGVGSIGYSSERNGRIIPGYANEPAKDVRGNIVGWPVSGRYPWRLAEYIDHQIEGAILVNEQEALLGDTTANAYSISIGPTLGMNMYYIGGDLVSGFPKMWIDKRTQAHSPSRLIAFGSARSNTGFTASGFFRIEGPSYSPNNPAGWSSTFNENDPAFLFGFVHPRWDSRAIFSHMDAHAEPLTIPQMRDMTRWSSEAARLNNPNWKPF